MNPTRQRRMWFVIAFIAAAAIAGALIVFALQSNISYLYTPSEVLGGQAADQARFRLGGMVKKDSWKRTEGSLQNRFLVTDGDADLPVEYNGILPDLFRENQAVIATGSVVDGTFVATEVLAKHDETYMPREVAEKMGVAHEKHKVADEAPAEAPASQSASPEPVTSQGG